ncbi:hypothetical protein TNCV_2113921 [Trichonephila clavipes]|nr:hypothetical protein TNCV_2113921 [Trichonephila clavipes]
MHPPTKYDAVANHQPRDLGQTFLEKRRAVGSVVVRASDFRSEGLGWKPDNTNYPPSTHGVRTRYISGSESLVG